MASKTQRFRQLNEAGAVLIQRGVYDGFSARLVQQMGFETIKNMAQRFLTAAQRQAIYGAAAQ